MESEQRRLLRLTKTACSPEMASTLVPTGRRRYSAVCALAVPSALSTASFRGPLISQSEIKARVVSGDTRATGHKMKRFFLLPAAVMLGLTSASTVPVQAGGGDVAAGLIGGLAAGTIIGAAVTAPRYYGPPPVYVAPEPYCYWTRGEPVWDGYRGVWTYPAVRVCE
jgi:hypothetical protein